MSPIPLTKQEKRTFSKYNKWSRLGAEAGISCILYGSGTKVNEDIENFVCNHFKGSSEDISDFMNFVAILSGIVKNHDFVSDIAFTKFC